MLERSTQALEHYNPLQWSEETKYDTLLWCSTWMLQEIVSWHKLRWTLDAETTARIAKAMHFLK